MTFKQPRRFRSSTTQPEALAITVVQPFALVDGLGFLLVEVGPPERYACYPQRRLAERALGQAQAQRMNCALWERP